MNWTAKLNILAAAFFLPLSGASSQPAPSSGAVPVTADNFVRAETDMFFGGVVRQGGLGKFYHNREPMSIDHQAVVRGNRDTLYSPAVIDLDAGPVTVTLPDAGTRFRSMIVINEDHYAPQVIYDAGSYTFTRAQIGTRYVLLAMRTLVDPDDPKDLAKVHALQDASTIGQPGGPGKWEVPNWDQANQKKVRDALLVLASTLPNSDHMFGTKNEVDPIRHFIGSASVWGGNPDKEAKYLNVFPARNDGQTVYRLIVPPNVPVDGFWSVSVYNRDGYMVANKFNAYSFNNITAKKSTDGSVAVQFGGCDGKIPNCLPIMAGWNYMVRLYRPRPEILDGRWKFPEAQPVG
jgi:hypothetical protein